MGLDLNVDQQREDNHVWDYVSEHLHKQQPLASPINEIFWSGTRAMNEEKINKWGRIVGNIVMDICGA